FIYNAGGKLIQRPTTVAQPVQDAKTFTRPTTPRQTSHQHRRHRPRHLPPRLDVRPLRRGDHRPPEQTENA
ncbi:MAG: hypothetical protein PSX80_02260, partial [bacterium]|nr:hypothetical protein [bacterium]